MFVRIWAQKDKVVRFVSNWHTWYLKNPDSYSNISFLKFRPQNSFLGKFWPKQSKLSVLPENWYIWYLMEADSSSNSSFLNFKFIFQLLFSEFQTKNQLLAKFWPKKSNLSILSKNWHTLKMRILIPKLFSWILKPKSIFWAELVPGSEIACFVWCSYTTYLKGADLFHLKSLMEKITKEVCKCW